MKYLFAKSDKLLYDNTIDEAVCMTDYVSEEKMIMERMMTHNIKKDILYYGIYSTADDMWNGSDVLCAARKRFFETGSRQKKRSTIKTDNVTYSYHYAIENGVLLKYKKTKGGQTVEWVVETPDGYYVDGTGAWDGAPAQGN